MPSLPLDICPPQASGGTGQPHPIVFAAAAVGMGTSIANSLGYKPPEVVSGYQHVQAGSKLMDQTLEILHDQKKGVDAIPHGQRVDFINEYADLEKDKAELKDATRTYTGSLLNWNDARRFYKHAYDLHESTKRSSDDGMAQNVKALALQQAGKKGGFQPPVYLDKRINPPERHDSHDITTANDSCWNPDEGGQGSWSRVAHINSSSYTRDGPTRAHGQSPVPTGWEATSPTMSSSEWAQHTATTGVYPYKSRKPSARRDH